MRGIRFSSLRWSSACRDTRPFRDETSFPFLVEVPSAIRALFTFLLRSTEGREGGGRGVNIA